MNTISRLHQTHTKTQTLLSAIDGYWKNDIWHLDCYHFQEFRKNLWDKTFRRIDFTPFRTSIKNEIKFFMINRLKD